MHGLVFAEFEKFVTREHGSSAWQEVLSAANKPAQVFVALGTYPDADLLDLLHHASVVTASNPEQLLEGFGEHLTPTLLRMYRTLVAPEWRTLDLIENTERVIHDVVRSRGGTPPALTTRRTGPSSLTLVYGSPRRLCALARGIIRGIALHYREEVHVKEVACMHSGARTCQMDISVSPRAAARG